MPNNRRKRKYRGRRRKKGTWFSRLSTGKRIGVCLAGILVCFLASTVIFVAAKLGKLDTEEIPKEDIVINDLADEVGVGYTNIAIFGGDSRKGEVEKGINTDCIIVASLNNRTKEVKMVSVYRDTLVDVGGGALQKANSAYARGGAEQGINMLNRNLDLDIEKYVTVDFGAVAEVVDSLGGIEIELTDVEVKYLNKFLAETARSAGKEAHYVQQSGLQKLDGVQATTYARIRSTAGSDFKRTERQRLVIEKIVEKALNSDIGTINNVIDKVLPRISTNFTAAEIFGYAKDFQKYKLGENSGFPKKVNTDTLPGKGDVVVPITLESNVVELHKFLYGEENYEPTTTVKEISYSIWSLAGDRPSYDVDAAVPSNGKKENDGEPHVTERKRPEVKITPANE